MKKILVTGGAGFIGTNFIYHALEKFPDWRIVNLDKLTYAGNPANFSTLTDEQSCRYQLVQGDIADPAVVTRVFSEGSFDLVFHFAAESHVDRSILGPDAFVTTNMVGTFQLLEAARQSWESGGRSDDFRFIHVSTDEVYGSLGADGMFTEETAYDPSSPYSASKAGSDHLAKAYHRTYGMPVIVTNCSNNYGPYQFPEKLIPLMILNVLEKKQLPVYGDGKNVRDWLFVDDHCDALITVSEKGRAGETYNIGGNTERENIEIVHSVCDLVDDAMGRPAGESRALITYVSDRPGHDRRYAIDAEKIKNELGWQPRYEFTNALMKTVKWYLDNLSWVNDIRSGEYQNWLQRQYENRKDMVV